MNDTLYCIMWESRITGKRGRGTGWFSYEEAMAHVRALNAGQSGRFLHHWAEPMPDKVPV